MLLFCHLNCKISRGLLAAWIWPHLNLPILSISLSRLKRHPQKKQSHKLFLWALNYHDSVVFILVFQHLFILSLNVSKTKKRCKITLQMNKWLCWQNNIRRLWIVVVVVVVIISYFMNFNRKIRTSQHQ